MMSLKNSVVDAAASRLSAVPRFADRPGVSMHTVTGQQLGFVWRCLVVGLAVGCLTLSPAVAQSMGGSGTRNSAGVIPKPKVQDSAPGNKIEKVRKSDAEWRRQLNTVEYTVTRRKGTERAFTGKYWNTKKDGVYVCKCCGLPLFDSKTKFKSGTGWPSYFAPLDADNVGHVADRSHGMVRTEVICQRCDAHLGHVFRDGPKPTGLRYCMNSVSLNFVGREEFELLQKKQEKTPTADPPGDQPDANRKSGG